MIMNLKYSSGGLRRWYNPPWFSECTPSAPYDALALREAFEKACADSLLFILYYQCPLVLKFLTWKLSGILINFEIYILHSCIIVSCVVNQMTCNECLC